MHGRALLSVDGRVQGVFFRHSARIRAARLGLTGTAENLNDGSLRIILEGERAKLDEFIAWAKSGPPLARVDEIAITWGQPTGEYSGFKIL
jgi:acylphosphatase